MMIIDELLITSEQLEGGNFLTTRGFSLEFILERFIVWTQTILSGNFQDEIQKLLNENIINPLDPDRKIPNFKFQLSDDPRITELSIEAQYTGQNLYEVIRDLCRERDVGFKIILNEDNEFVFSLYIGIDRSYAQDINPYVIFSHEFDNIINSSYLKSTRILKNVALVAGEGEGVNRRTTTVGSGSGLKRRELFVDARDISSQTSSGTLSNDQYMAQLALRGQQRLSEFKLVTEFEGDAETTKIYVYGEHFFLGDIVHLLNEFGIGENVRMDEVIFSYNNEGISTVPGFSVIKETEGEQ